MKIFLAGGGSGGHFYPIIAVAKALQDLSEEERLLAPEITLASDFNYDPSTLQLYNIKFKKISAGKIRRYFSLLNIIDLFKTFIGTIKSIFVIYSNMPDVVFGKGGFASFPILLAARIFGIPIIIHESDSVPGKVNKWASKFAKKIAISFPEVAKYFPPKKTALTGLPIRKSILGSNKAEAIEVFGLEPNVPTILIVGGSQGAQKINDVVIDALNDLVKSYQIIHQCGKKNEKEVQGRTGVVLENSPLKNRYHLYPYLNDSLLRNASAVADLVISRGSSSIHEIALWGLPSIVIPIKNSAQNHQNENAYNYSRLGAAEVIEEINLSPHVFLSEIQRIMQDKNRQETMRASAKKFAKPDAARKIAQEILNLALEHSQ